MSVPEVDKLDIVASRSAEAGDVAFILATWLRGLKFGNSWYKLIDNRAYYEVYHQVLVNMLSKATVTIACLKNEPDVILGYCVYDKYRIHWVHVKKDWRKIGIARMIVPKDIKVVSHLTEVGKSIFLKRKDLSFNPFLLT